MTFVIVFNFGVEIRGIDIWVALGCTRRSPAGFGSFPSGHADWLILQPPRRKLPSAIEHNLYPLYPAGYQNVTAEASDHDHGKASHALTRRPACIFLLPPRPNFHLSDVVFPPWLSFLFPLS